jgi:hypothetical protein
MENLVEEELRRKGRRERGEEEDVASNSKSSNATKM